MQYSDGTETPYVQSSNVLAGEQRRTAPAIAPIVREANQNMQGVYLRAAGFSFPARKDGRFQIRSFVMGILHICWLNVL
jgi:hypothetical protein